MQISLLKVILAPAVLAFNLVSTLTACADPGVFDDRIVFGQSAALKGPGSRPRPRHAGGHIGGVP